ncbi:hypothetical protein [Salinibacillus xinjiangensis]|uniref:Uncharacterized protein n=1 Tax=Salinibacillus xinjiangensis TaxID=1229268 RepID=A0A6G1X9T8_9BACI|nr:hypothetical protein [Salinibacillus xinjiangensis]MRG87781.1 hypothetical protein [Salinibacillus xinjiangensis]
MYRLLAMATIFLISFILSIYVHDHSLSKPADDNLLLHQGVTDSLQFEDSEKLKFTLGKPALTLQLITIHDKLLYTSLTYVPSEKRWVTPIFYQSNYVIPSPMKMNI